MRKGQKQNKYTAEFKERAVKMYADTSPGGEIRSLLAATKKQLFPYNFVKK